MDRKNIYESTLTQSISHIVNSYGQEMCLKYNYICLKSACIRVSIASLMLQNEQDLII